MREVALEGIGGLVSCRPFDGSQVSLSSSTLPVPPSMSKPQEPCSAAPWQGVQSIPFQDVLGSGEGDSSAFRIKTRRTLPSTRSFVIKYDLCLLERAGFTRDCSSSLFCWGQARLESFSGKPQVLKSGAHPRRSWMRVAPPGSFVLNEKMKKSLNNCFRP